MTLPGFRSRRQRETAIAGGFPDTGETIPEIRKRVRPDSYDSTAITFSGASGAGLDPDDVYGEADPAAGLRQAIEMTAMADRYPGTRLRSQDPAALPAPPPQPQPPPQRRPDCAIWAILRGGEVGLLCGIDRWRRHADPEIAHVRYGVFNALRASALAAGWRVDANGVWCCPRCKMDPAYHTPQPLDHYHPDAAGGRGHMITGHEGYRDAQFWLQVEAENEVLRRTRDGARPGRHRAAGAR